ncbi:3-hydroxy-3-methylglutaryl-coenzyme A reductase [Pyricularia oryzae 70-15]|uniref:3-hydroxy-3-methylglutaryl coenzyme A reductase n=3 Tax=Pyricularia oryzae TaxID=318829 RepID=G4MWF9_PYRO7|nr:3-hydroxy-3-methylglutaryl-coenzyme A reductase [Pyricularia oryzae 70-15]EHA54207.1 3-hydroxy-3-methylglutaryl-coenzyme A reductase [Pyricularia oryzae 70-15]ELQ41260.1 3-hydroxy-3-methylglutaryl-coenzyme A reductase [Pyricularia oryzae Y34]KAI7918706.1 3-hydroxy-3-methylglutaryl-coenzyme A reductase [Pyricularia oryzae]KAI7920707.1 3-hydroxy-3-methylglutaryl-coenzyme A reductase [Pyricularia oryzae]
MIASSLIPSRFRGSRPGEKAPPPSWLNRKVTPFLQKLAGITSSHPIHTVAIVALLASSTYIGLLEESLFDANWSVRKADWSSLTEGSRTLWTAPDTEWKWQSHELSGNPPAANSKHLALLTFIFPDSLDDAPKTAPLQHTVPIPDNLTITPLPSTSNSLTTYSQDSALAFSLPYDQAPEFLAAAQEIPNETSGQDARESENGREKKMWIMKAARVHTRSSVIRWFQNAWMEFIDTLKNAETLDIIIMVLGYLSMHLTFVSLFLSMRRMGSNFWLAANTLFSSVFSFLFGLIVTTKLGVPITVVLLSEGLPFLVVTIGFEKNIVLTRAVLSHAIEHRRADTVKQSKSAGSQKSASGNGSQSVIQYAIQMAIKEKAYGILKDYAIEILILVCGAASGVQGGLQQFCFLAAWILFFDCILLFTFYTAILYIKLEINRIKRHVEMRKALEDDGLSRRVAENVASSNDWPAGKGSNTSLFGKQIKSTSVPKFKGMMVSGFIIINLLNLCSIPFRSTHSLSSLSTWAGGLGGVLNSPPVDPFKVAANGLDEILGEAKSTNTETIVTILTPIKYELEYPSVHYALPPPKSAVPPEADLGYGVGGRMVGGILKSLEDPVLSKWIVVALAMSVALNGYLFNAALMGIKDPNAATQPINPRELADAQKFNDTDQAMLPLGEYQPPTAPPTPRRQPSPGVEEESDSGRTQVDNSPLPPAVPRTAAEIDTILKEKRVYELSDEEIVAYSLKGKIPGYSLERSLKDCTRAVKIRRTIISRTKATSSITSLLDRSKLPYRNYNWEQVLGACCENVIGFMPLPVGVAGPLVIDGQSYFIPMATTEGVLVASASRGCKAINAGGGAVTVLTGDGMTRGPCVGFETLERAGAAKNWLDSDVGQAFMTKAFNSTSRFARLESMKTAIAGTNLYIRFRTTTGDAMGMNMISKGVEEALRAMAAPDEGGFTDMQILTLSGNYCSDKKPAAINWIEGRGKSVVAEAIIPGDIVRSVLKIDVDSLVEMNISKNLIGSAMAGAMGGFNAHAANIVAAVFLATGQDPAQVVESANCITIMRNLRGNLQISVSMPSIEVGTLGGGTILEPQSAMLDLLGVRGSHPTTPGDNARRLARIIAAAVLAGELSLCSALAAGHLVKAHMAHNRSTPATRSTTPAPPATGSGSGFMTPVGLAMTSAVEKATGGTLRSNKSSASLERQAAVGR